MHLSIMAIGPSGSTVHIAAHKRSALPQLICRCAAGSTNHNSPPETIGKCRLPPASDTGGVTPQRRWNAVCLAYLGDGVWEAALRQRFYDAANTKQYNSTVAALTNTQAQAACYQLLLDEDWVTNDEAALMRWASNSSSVAPPSHASRQQYKQATAVETLVAHLYLTDTTRLQQLLDWLLHPSHVKVTAASVQPQSASSQGADK